MFDITLYEKINHACYTAFTKVCRIEICMYIALPVSKTKVLGIITV